MWMMYLEELEWELEQKGVHRIEGGDRDGKEYLNSRKGERRRH